MRADQPLQIGALMGLVCIEHSHGDYWMYREYSCFRIQPDSDSYGLLLLKVGTSNWGGHDYHTPVHCQIRRFQAEYLIR